MAHLPTVSIIGRPNTGKSRLFNRLVGRRSAIVSDIPGTTRDQIAKRIEGESVDYLLVDTGGMGGGSTDSDLEDDVEKQSMLALTHSDLILFTVSSTEELTASDFAVVDRLRKDRKEHVPVIVVVTKCDNPLTIDEVLPQFYQLGISDEIVAVSAPHDIGTDELSKNIEDALVELHFKKQERHDAAAEGASQTPRIALIGKPNVGKSSLINAFLSETERAKSPLLVSDIPGTTRDATEKVIRYHDEEFIFTDTAGLRRHPDDDSAIETYAAFRSMQALEECDIAILVLDALKPVSRQDKRIASLAVEDGKGLIILVNKIDALPDGKKADVLAAIERDLAFCRFAPILPCSAESREGLLKIFDLLEMVQRNRTRRIPTGELVQWYRDAVYDKPMQELQRSKLITQAEDLPPTFVLFVKDPKKVQVSQLRYLDSRIRKTFGFEGTPVRWVTKVG